MEEDVANYCTLHTYKHVKTKFTSFFCSWLFFFCSLKFNFFSSFLCLENSINPKKLPLELTITILIRNRLTNLILVRVSFFTLDYYKRYRKENI